MKIGILTYHRSQNYGALLQAKALQDFIKSLGHDVSFVDYWPSYHEDMYKAFSLRKLKKINAKNKVRYIFRFVFTLVRLNKRRNRTKNYIKKYLSISQDKQFDLVLYGSDQIWRKQHQPTCDWFNPVYWGDGYVETTHKIAYAASMGKVEIDTSDDRKFVITHLNLFDAVGLREKDLADCLHADFGLDYPMVCDPVFLLTKEQWKQHINTNFIPKKKYILYYRLQDIKATDSMVEELRIKTSYDIIEMRGYIPMFHYGSKYRFTADAQEFISLIYGADYVVTSSFHGTALSIIFEKQFFFTSKIHKANRVASLLNLLGLENRFSSGTAAEVNTKDIIDYNIIKPRIEAFSKHSREWLANEIVKCSSTNS